MGVSHIFLLLFPVLHILLARVVRQEIISNLHTLADNLQLQISQMPSLDYVRSLEEVFLQKFAVESSMSVSKPLEILIVQIVSWNKIMHFSSEIL